MATRCYWSRTNQWGHCADTCGYECHAYLCIGAFFLSPYCRKLSFWRGWQWRHFRGFWNAGRERDIR